MATQNAMVLLISLLTIGLLFMLGQTKADQFRFMQRQQLCGNKSLELNYRSDVDRTSTMKCPEHIKKAFDEFVTIMKQPNDCTMDKAVKITNFYATHLKGPLELLPPPPSPESTTTSRPIPSSSLTPPRPPPQQAMTTPTKSGQVNDDDDGQLPWQFVRFALAYGMQVSNRCKLLLVTEFYGSVTESLDYRDFLVLNDWIGYGTLFYNFLGPIQSRNAVFPLPSDFTALIPDFESKFKLALKTPNIGRLQLAEEVCEKRFRPLYEPIVLPIAHLARHGINFSRFMLGNDLILEQDLRKKNELYERIVFFCETLKEFKVLQAPANDGTSINIVANDKVEPNGHAKSGLVPTNFDVKPLKRYEPYANVDDKIYRNRDILLWYAIHSYKPGESEVARLRRKILDDKWSLLMAGARSSDRLLNTLKDIVETAVLEVSGGHDVEEVKLVGRYLLNMLKADKKSRFFSAISRLSRSVRCVFRQLVLCLESFLILFLTICAIFPMRFYEKYLKSL